MNFWTNKDHRTVLDDAEDFGDQPSGGSIKKWLAGIALPLGPILFGICSLVAGRATFFGRNGSSDIGGLPAVALNVAYMAIGLFLHFHYFWGLDERLCRYNQPLKMICLLAFIPCVLYALAATLTIFS